MELPVLSGIIDRRILINYRVKPEVVKALLPPNLEPLVINGYASAGICLLRLKNIGVKYTPSIFRITSENLAHRFLVRYKGKGDPINCVYIPRRDTDSLLNVWLAGKIFSWPHYPANFTVEEGDGKYTVDMRSKVSNITVSLSAQLTNGFPFASMFGSLEQVSKCFRECPLGISPTTDPNRFKMIRLTTADWAVRPLQVNYLKSTFFEDTSLFPEESISFDNALLMEGIAHEWHSIPHGRLFPSNTNRI